MDSDPRKTFDFRFSIPQPPTGPLVQLSAAEAEKILLKRLEGQGAEPTDALWQLARFYSHCKDHEKALGYLRELLARLPDLESKANCVLAMGQTMERVQDYPAAVRYYREALAMEPARTATWYFINNNLGFSLNTLTQFVEGEKYCRKAIEVDPNRPNAHKNLGIALAGQGNYHAAAQCFVRATQANAADPRSLRLLEVLLHDHPDLEFEFKEAAESCQKAVEAVGKKVEELKPVVYRGWRKHLILLRTRLRSFGQQLAKVCSRL